MEQGGRFEHDHIRPNEAIGVVMVRDTEAKDAQLILNEESGDHAEALKVLMRSAHRLVCMTAFAKKTGLKLIRKELEERLDGGLEALFVVGLNFYQTDPFVLEELHALSKRYSLQLLVSRPPWIYREAPGGNQAMDNTAWNFHPKVFMVECTGETNALIGSANLTGGGLADNHEASVLIRNCGVIAKRINDQIAHLIEDKQIVPADAGIISEYARRHAIYKIHTKLAERRADRAIARKDGIDLDTLKSLLSEMRADTSGSGFEADTIYRSNARIKAGEVLTQISVGPPLSEKGFLRLYEPLVADLWHSGGLQRGKSLVAKHAHAFQDALRSLDDIESLSLEKAFDLLHGKMQNVKGAGINVITEILHTFDNVRFAVMNQNSVSGIGVAGITGFPKHPYKGDVDGAMYASFCDRAGDIRDGLQLKDFTELDALFNYAYWER